MGICTYIQLNITAHKQFKAYTQNKGTLWYEIVLYNAPAKYQDFIIHNLGTDWVKSHFSNNNEPLNSYSK